jgi:hypothetical protein
VIADLKDMEGQYVQVNYVELPNVPWGDTRYFIVAVKSKLAFKIK